MAAVLPCAAAPATEKLMPRDFEGGAKPSSRPAPPTAADHADLVAEAKKAARNDSETQKLVPLILKAEYLSTYQKHLMIASWLHPLAVQRASAIYSKVINLWITIAVAVGHGLITIGQGFSLIFTDSHAAKIIPLCLVVVTAGIHASQSILQRWQKVPEVIEKEANALEALGKNFLAAHVDRSPTKAEFALVLSQIEALRVTTDRDILTLAEKALEAEIKAAPATAASATPVETRTLLS